MDVHFYVMCERFQRDVKTLLKDGTISITHANEEDKEALLKKNRYLDGKMQSSAVSNGLLQIVR